MKKIGLVQLAAAVILLFSPMSYADGYYRHRGYGNGGHHEHHRHHRQSYYQQPPVVYYQPQPPVRYYQQPPVHYYPQPQVIYPQPRYYSGNELRLNW